MINNSIKENSEAYKGYQLHSAFQPIISIAHRRAVGYEGLVRASTDEGVQCSPFELFKLPQSSEEHLELDRLCRSLHIKNFTNQETSDEWLFLNLDSQCLALEKPKQGFMESLFSLYDISPHRVVIEILESEVGDRHYLKKLIGDFRAAGCLIAIDDFGAGHSNFERIWELEPDIIKLDRSLIQRAATTSKVKRILSGMVSLIHETGSLVIIEGVETEKEAEVAIEVNADMVQGFYFARPKEVIYKNKEFDTSLNKLLCLKREHVGSRTSVSQYLSNVEKQVILAMNNFNQVDSLELLYHQIMLIEQVMRCYLLDKAGNQIGKNITSSHYQNYLDIRFTPLLSGANANWSHKHYHTRAIADPMRAQVTRPYLSIAGSHLCITISKAIKFDNMTYVLCCDLDWRDD